MKTISIFILLLYWSIMIFGPVMSKDFKINKAQINKTEMTPISKAIR